MTPLLFAATALQTVQCNTVDNVGRIAPYAIEFGKADNRVALTVRPLDPRARPIGVANPDDATSSYSTVPLSEISFDATLDGVTYDARLSLKPTRPGEREWALEFIGKQGDRRKLVLLLGICGDGFRPAFSPAQPLVPKHALNCYAVMVSGRMFAFTYDFLPGNRGTMISGDKSLWQAGSAAVTASGPRGPDGGEVFIDFSSVAPLAGTDGPLGFKVMAINRKSTLASYQFQLFNIENKAAQGGMKRNAAFALCREFSIAPPS